MSSTSGRVTLAFSCLGHAYMHFFTAFYFVIVLALETDWQRPYHELIELWTLGALLVGVGAIPAGWLSDRWSAGGMMIVMFLGLGLAGHRRQGGRRLLRFQRTVRARPRRQASLVGRPGAAAGQARARRGQLARFT